LLPPLLEIMVNGTGTAKALGQRLPLATGAQHIHDGSENLTWRNGFAATAGTSPVFPSALWARGARRQERFDA